MSGTKKPGKTPRDPGDPGFWRRPLSNRSIWVLGIVAGAIVLAAVIASLALGLRLF